MKIPDGFEVRIYDDCYQFDGKTYFGPKNIPDLGTMNDRISSIAIVKVETASPTPMCCKAMTKACLACSAGTTEEAYCEANPGKYDCPAVKRAP